MVGYGSYKNQNFIRLVAVNRENEVDDIQEFFKRLEAFAKQKDPLKQKDFIFSKDGTLLKLLKNIR